jgi:hypothetical protein
LLGFIEPEPSSCSSCFLSSLGNLSNSLSSLDILPNIASSSFYKKLFKQFEYNSDINENDQFKNPDPNENDDFIKQLSITSNIVIQVFLKPQKSNVVFHYSDSLSKGIIFVFHLFGYVKGAILFFIYLFRSKG